MAKQEYILKKYVSANSAAEALELDESTKVSEVFLVADKPTSSGNVSAIGFSIGLTEE